MVKKQRKGGKANKMVKGKKKHMEGDIDPVIVVDGSNFYHKIHFDEKKCMRDLGWWSKKLPDGRVLRFCCPSKGYWDNKKRRCSLSKHVSTLVPKNLSERDLKKHGVDKKSVLK